MNRSAVQYSRQMKEWLSAYKYQGHERLHTILALMLEYAYLQLVQALSPDGRPFRPLITSVPISDLRMQERGFNQAERLAESLAARHRLPYVRLLRRIRHTSRQSLKSRQERIMDLRGAFAVIREAIPDAGACPSDIVIIDDVYTTGSTLHECARVLHTEIQASIYSLTWAR
jgi:ComF family protein